MKTLLTKSAAIAVAIAIVTNFVLAPASAKAAWRDRSDELPGIDFNPTPYLIAAGVLVGGLIIYKVATHKSDDDKDNSPATETAANTSTATDEAATPSDSTQVSQVGSADSQTDLRIQDQTKLNLYMNVTDDRSTYGSRKPRLDFSDMTLRAGVTIGF